MIYFFSAQEIFQIFLMIINFLHLFDAYHFDLLFKSSYVVLFFKYTLLLNSGPTLKVNLKCTFLEQNLSKVDYILDDYNLENKPISFLENFSKLT